MRLIYVMDPICSWSYAGSKVILDLYIRYKWKFEFDLLPAGMFAGEKARKQDSQLTNYIRLQDHQIQTHTGVEFGIAYFRFLDDPSIVLNSETPSRAILTVKSLWQDAVFQFASKVQSARFQEGRDLNQDDTYIKICDEMGWNKETFLQDFHSDAMKKLTQESFEVAARYANVYPSLLLETPDKLIPVTKGYASFEEVEKKLKASLPPRR